MVGLTGAYNLTCTLPITYTTIYAIQATHQVKDGYAPGIDERTLSTFRLRQTTTSRECTIIALGY